MRIASSHWILARLDMSRAPREWRLGRRHVKLGRMQGAPRKRSGCVVAVYTLFAVGLLGAIAIGVGLALFFQSERGQEVLEAVQSGAELITTASQAEGTEELRSTGCEMALAASASTALDALASFLPDEEIMELRRKITAGLEDSVDAEEFADLHLVMCVAGGLDADEDNCSELARVYWNAVWSPPRGFVLIKTKQGRNEPVCQGFYDQSGDLTDRL